MYLLIKKGLPMFNNSSTNVVVIRKYLLENNVFLTFIIFTPGIEMKITIFVYYLSLSVSANTLNLQNVPELPNIT